MLSYGIARDSMVGALLRDAMAHERGDYEEIGRQFERIERELPAGAAAPLAKLRVALTFWDGWIGARDGGWQAGGDIDRTEWPVLARRIASNLIENQEIGDARVAARFGGSVRGLTP